MGYEIIYDLKAVKTSRGVTLMCLVGPNNVTTLRNGRERRVREWDLFNHALLDVPAADAMVRVSEMFENANPNYECFKKGGKWYYPEQAEKLLITAIRRAATIEDIKAADPHGMLDGYVVADQSVEGERVRKRFYQCAFISTTEQFEDWVDKVRPFYEECKDNDRHPEIRLKFSGEEPLRRGPSKATQKGEVVIKIGRSSYVHDITATSYSRTRYPNEAKVFASYEEANELVKSVNAWSKERLNIVSKRSVDEAAEKKTVLRIVKGSYAGEFIKSLSSCRIFFAHDYKYAKRFRSKEDAEKWAADHRIFDRWSHAIDALAAIEVEEPQN